MKDGSYYLIFSFLSLLSWWLAWSRAIAGRWGEATSKFSGELVSWSNTLLTEATSAPVSSGSWLIGETFLPRAAAGVLALPRKRCGDLTECHYLLLLPPHIHTTPTPSPLPSNCLWLCLLYVFFPALPFTPLPSPFSWFICLSVCFLSYHCFTSVYPRLRFLHLSGSITLFPPNPTYTLGPQTHNGH